MPAVSCCMSGPACDELELMLDVLVSPASATAAATTASATAAATTASATTASATTAAAASTSFSISQPHHAQSLTGVLPAAVGRSGSRAHMSASGLGNTGLPSGSTRTVAQQPLATAASPFLVRGSSRASNSAGMGLGPGAKGAGGGAANGELLTLVGSMGGVVSEAGLAQQANASASSFSRDLTGACCVSADLLPAALHICARCQGYVCRG